MPPPIPIQTPDPEGERPRAWTVAAVAAAGLVLGILLVRATLDEPTRVAEAPTPAEEAAPPAAEAGGDAGHASAAPAVDPDAGHAPAPLEAEAEAEAGAEPEAEAEAEPEAGAGAEAEAGAEPEPEPDATAPAAPPAPGAALATDRTVQLGRIAYLRCDGAETGEGPYPCPRDRDLEQAAIAAIETLPACPNAPGGTGESDVRIHYVPDGPNEILLRHGSGEGVLDGAGVLACLREPLSQLTTTIEADQLVVSFRFELVSSD